MDYLIKNNKSIMDYSLKNCLLIGGGGFIGSNLAEELVSQGHNVTIYSLGESKKNQNLINILSKIRYIQGDIKNLNLIKKTIKKNDYVFDLATSSIPSSTPDETINDILNHTHLFDIACQKKASKIIFASSGGGVYGNKTKMPISETQYLQPSSPHSISKATLEFYLDYFAKQNETPYLIYRISNPYGPKQTPKPGFGLIPTLFHHVLNNTQPTLFDNGQAVRDFIYIDDLVKAISSSFYKNNLFNTYNIGSGKGTKIIDIWENIKKITNTEINPLFFPKRSFDVKKYILNTKRFSTEYKWKLQTNLYRGLKTTWGWLNR